MRSLWNSALDLFWPEENVCHLCGSWAYGSVLCQDCLKELLRQTIAPGSQPLIRPHAPQRVISVWKHASAARALVHKLKYQADPAAAGYLSDGMVCALLNEQTVLKETDLLVPVPLHPAREKERGYNQAALLAQNISRQTGIPVAENVLFRTRDTGKLERLSRAERLGAFANVFAAGSPALIAGKNILLVDDVFTTGATAQACADTLLQSGAAQVCAVTACRA